ncbi:molybdenum cofactor guanylyltransferase [Paraurantiacibacter namhicola]|uniref:Molybdopterin-guanine dinucleotide biosynthesis protein MobA n=1 Tax=Paraurantiacibacter namhicola TaxID=645517 RepID=A0A1C7D4P2_9SPHN|nr:molybdenum cofactor guanylyltransferase [Paraurantiacibacter namhicola]ANU06428.1 molybdopterin-guanine dinucleotide biosynthesis protein MobA [Paraurantiacibacter namhicola]
MILGAVLAGGQSSRFGSDKAQAQLHGETLLERAVNQLSAQCDAVVVVGREEAPVTALADWPRPGMGPLGGIAAVLRHAGENDCESVLTCGVDSVALPADLLDQLGSPPAYAASQPVIGHWPASGFAQVAEILRGDGRHSMLQFAQSLGARNVHLNTKPDNINTQADLAAAEARDDL